MGLGKGVVKVNGQAAFFVNLFGTGFFHVLCGGVESLSNTLTNLTGKDLTLKELLVKGRAKLLQQFELQSRVTAEKLFASQEGDLSLADVKNLYKKYEGGDVIAERVMKEWDKNADGQIAIHERELATPSRRGNSSLSA